MMKSLKGSAALASFLLALAATATAAPQPGTVKAFRVDGDVKIKVESTGQTSALRDGQVFSEGSTVITGEEGTVILHFSNGSTISVDSGTSLSLKQYLQEPFSSKRSYNQLREDPSVSRTKMHLNYGNVLARTRKLQAGSVYEIDTNVGSAGIRGSTASVTYVPDANGGTMTIGNITGDIEATAWALAAGQVIVGQVELWKKVTGTTKLEIRVSLNPTTNQPEYTIATDLPFTPAEQDTIRQHLRRISVRTGTEDADRPTNEVPIEVDVNIVSPAGQQRRNNSSSSTSTDN